jgi:predicted 3-demethylubiquinone-9 3-methyltransferase (glyoxalase superfamily)
MKNNIQKITPFLWFDKQAEEAMNFYASIFKNSKVVSIKRYPEGPLEGPMQGLEGKVITGVFELEGQRFMALDGGPAFTFTPAVSFFVNCETQEDIDELWEKLSEGGIILMELDRYPFSEKFGWVEDKFGLSWQLNLATLPQKIIPFLMFVGEQHGKAEEALKLYTSLFENSSIARIERYGPGQEEPEGTVMHAMFSLNGQAFMAMDSNREHPFTFNEAISFYVECNSQEEVDYYWENLSQGGDKNAQQCGWLKDTYGVSWQIIPTALPELLNDPDPEKSQRVMQAMLQMKKIDIKALKQAYELQ